MKKTDKREFVKPRLYHKVIKDIEQTIDKIIKDDRSIDRSFWKDHIKFSDVVLMDPMMTQDPDKNMKEVVESSSIYLYVNTPSHTIPQSCKRRSNGLYVISKETLTIFYETNR